MTSYVQNVSSEVVLVLLGLGVALLAILLLKFGKQIAIFLLVLLGVGAVLAIAIALAGQSAANVQTAKAVVEASRGQSNANLAATILAILSVIVTVAGGGVALYFYLRARRAESQVGDKGWVSGPNAMWGRKNTQSMLPAMPPDTMMQFYLLTQQMQQMQMMRQLMGMFSRMSGGYIPGRPPAQLSYPQDPMLPDGDGWWPDGFEE